MKKLFLAIMLGIFCTATMAQNAGTVKNAPKELIVPTDVQAAFKKDFPTAQNAKWEKEDSNYEVNFKIDKDQMSALYDKKGYRKEIETEIEMNKLPVVIIDYIKNNYADAKFSEAAKITSDKGVKTFEVRVKKNNKPMDLIFDENGKFLKKEKAD